MRKPDPKIITERRQQILEAAISCFKEKGFHGASMSTICNKAGMSPGHLYHYFRSKEDLIAAIVDLDTQKVQSTLESLMNSNDTIQTMIDQVEKYWRDESQLNRALTAEILAEAVRNERIAKTLHQRVDFIKAGMMRALEAAKKRGTINQDLDIEGFGIMIISMFYGLSSLYSRTGLIDEKQVFSSITEMLLRTLTPKADS